MARRDDDRLHDVQSWGCWGLFARRGLRRH